MTRRPLSSAHSVMMTPQFPLGAGGAAAGLPRALAALLPASWAWTEALCLLNTFFVVGNVMQYALHQTQARYGRFSNATGVVKTAAKKDGAEAAAAAPASDSPLLSLLRYPVPARVAWFLMEAPNVLLTALVLTYATPWDELEGAPLRRRAAVALFAFHYLVRTFVYSFLIVGGKPLPLDTFLAGVLFTSVNGFVQTYHHTRPMSAAYWRQRDWTWHAAVQLVGLALFAFGFTMNQVSDRTLRMLRKSDSDTSYYIPRGFFFKWLSAPNLVGCEGAPAPAADRRH